MNCSHILISTDLTLLGNVCDSWSVILQTLPQPQSCFVFNKEWMSEAEFLEVGQLQLYNNEWNPYTENYF